MMTLPVRISYAFIFVLGSVYLVGSLQLPLGSMDMPGPGVFPLLVAAAMMGLSMAALLVSLGPAAKASRSAEFLPRGKERLCVISLTVLLVLFVLLLPFLGYASCSGGLMVGSLRLLGMRRWIRILIVSALTAAASTCLFSVLGVPLPKGSLLG
ncbi:MAG: tripartite tricarboxylate transporter TctB family protein [Thermodesulfobacteriota bacterium]